MSGFDGRTPGDGSWWLMKVPPRLAGAWRAAAEGEVLGEAVLGSEGRIELKVSSTAQSTSAYELVRNVERDVALRPFRKVVSHDGEGEAQTSGKLIGGQPVASFTLKPQQGIGYRRDLRHRMVESIQSTRATMVLDRPEATTRVSKPISVAKRKQDDDDALPAKRQRTQMDPKDLKAAVLAVLSKAQLADSLTLRDIKAHIGDAVAEKALKTALEQVADKSKGDGGRLVYQLKPEYRDNTSAPG
mmetsp:Transcript_1726/g.5255  ORF Transcript_1726/g.5255 Transcript_1726/m.5255 type:complete len:244 (+) Transcript_1726:212-943(+)